VSKSVGEKKKADSDHCGEGTRERDDRPQAKSGGTAPLPEPKKDAGEKEKEGKDNPPTNK